MLCFFARQSVAVSSDDRDEWVTLCPLMYHMKVVVDGFYSELYE